MRPEIRVTAVLDPETANALAQEAKRRNLPLSVTTRQIIQKSLGVVPAQPVKKP